MNTDIGTYLKRRFGDGCLTGRRTYPFEITRGGPEAVFDPYNRRMKLYGVDSEEFMAECAPLLVGPGSDPEVCSKVTIYALPDEDREWASLGFVKEGVIRGFFAGHINAVLWARYTDPDRAVASNTGLQDGLVNAAREKKKTEPALAHNYTSLRAAPADAPAIAELMTRTFGDYPSPTDPATLERLIRTGANLFRMVRAPDGELAAVASAEIDRKRKSAEMTDCATAPGHRGKGLMAYILSALGLDVASVYNITDVYSLCRADEPAINHVLAKLGYSYTGRLTNNCRMPNGWESMNVWCRVPGP